MVTTIPWPPMDKILDLKTPSIKAAKSFWLFGIKSLSIPSSGVAKGGGTARLGGSLASLEPFQAGRAEQSQMLPCLDRLCHPPLATPPVPSLGYSLSQA